MLALGRLISGQLHAVKATLLTLLKAVGEELEERAPEGTNPARGR